MTRMRRRLIFTAALALAGVGQASLGQPGPATTNASPPQTIELRNGQYWEPVATPKAAPVTDETLDRAGQLVAANSNAAAKKILVSWLKREATSQLRDRGLYLLGLANFQYGDRIRAFYNFDELLDYHPESKYFYPALQQQYETADASP